MEICLTYCTIWQYALRLTSELATGLRSLSIVRTLYGNGCIVWEDTMLKTGNPPKRTLQVLFILFCVGEYWPPASAIRPWAMATAAALALNFFLVGSRACGKLGIRWSVPYELKIMFALLATRSLGAYPLLAMLPTVSATFPTGYLSHSPSLWSSTFPCVVSYFSMFVHTATYLFYGSAAVLRTSI